MWTSGIFQAKKKKVQGKREEIYRRYGKDWEIIELGGGNGNWELSKKSDVLVDEISYRDFVLEHYNCDRLTEKLFDKFLEDVMSGRIKLQETRND